MTGNDYENNIIRYINHNPGCSDSGIIRDVSLFPSEDVAHSNIEGLLIMFIIKHLIDEGQIKQIDSKYYLPHWNE